VTDRFVTSQHVKGVRLSMGDDQFICNYAHKISRRDFDVKVGLRLMCHQLFFGHYKVCLNYCFKENLEVDGVHAFTWFGAGAITIAVSVSFFICWHTVGSSKVWLCQELTIRFTFFKSSQVCI